MKGSGESNLALETDASYHSASARSPAATARHPAARNPFSNSPRHPAASPSVIRKKDAKFAENRVQTSVSGIQASSSTTRPNVKISK